MTQRAGIISVLIFGFLSQPTDRPVKKEHRLGILLITISVPYTTTWTEYRDTHHANIRHTYLTRGTKYSKISWSSYQCDI